SLPQADGHIDRHDPVQQIAAVCLPSALPGISPWKVRHCCSYRRRNCETRPRVIPNRSATVDGCSPAIRAEMIERSRLTIMMSCVSMLSDAKSPCGRRGLPIPINRRMTKAGPSNRKLAPIAKFNQPKDSTIERNSFLRRPLSQNRT
ncbi:MAG: hypothetical protein ABSB74_19355, partial [Tepidisphaeraceae bacterium]